MAAKRFFCPDLDPQTPRVIGDDAAHARRSLRMRAGDAVELFDGRGLIVGGRIASLEKGEMHVEPLEVRRMDPPCPAVDVAVAPPKGARGDTLIEKLSELGVDRLTLLVTARTVVEPRPAKLERFERLAIESSKQCGRAHLMTICGPTGFEKVVGEAAHDLKLIADTPSAEERDAELVGHAAIAGVVNAASVLVLIGPEGGWEDREREEARAAGFQPWRFAPHVLRVETAAMAAAALLRASAPGSGSCAPRSGTLNHSDEQNYES